jgi:hypothetical protein
VSKTSDTVLDKANRHHHSATAEKLAREVAELEGANEAIMRDYQIEGDESVRDIVERTTRSAVALRDKADGLTRRVTELEGRVHGLKKASKRLLGSLDAHATGAFDGQDGLEEALKGGE